MALLRWEGGTDGRPAVLRSTGGDGEACTQGGGQRDGCGYRRAFR